MSSLNGAADPADIDSMTMRMLLLAAACSVALVVALPAGAKTPPPGVVASVGIEVAKLGLKASDIDTATSTCKTASCLSTS